ncbi:hypothetical protein L7F22_009098 [Adiantum nelumboides]|nr:hypothetical protein [Adiantum nelumboides]
MSSFDDASAPSNSFDLPYPPPPLTDLLYSPPAPPEDLGYSTSVSTSSDSSSSSSSKSIGIGIGVAVIFIVALVCIIVCVCCWRKKRRKRDQLASNTAGSIHTPPAPITQDYKAADASPLSGSVLEASKGDSGFKSGSIVSSSHNGNRGFSYEQLSVATKHFSDSELLGRGGSGAVYRGRLPEDGTLVAVKCIPENSNQGVKEFNAEVSIISELRHRNLVKLKGWCQGQGRFVLVYDYMPNGSLDSLLYNDVLCVKLHWERRYEIAMGLGAALLYLQGECERVIIHRDVKSSNVLLNENFTAKLGDFGLSRQVDLGVTSHVTTVVAGTRGYMAPECFVGSGKSTPETDVYAFGAVLLELVTGKRPLDWRLRAYDGVLVDWVWDLYGKGRVLQAVDQRLGREWEREEARRMLVVGLACSHPDPQRRPRIRHALEALHGTVALPDLAAKKPAVTLGASPPMSMSQLFSQGFDGVSSSTTSTHDSSSLYSASSHDSSPFTRPPSHFAR